LSKAPLRIVWILVAVVLLAGIFRLLSTRDHRSPDQKILLEKDKQ
jgi:hypothetical protein